jgi:predicted DNA-binding transcriptional regulator YafY
VSLPPGWAQLEPTAAKLYVTMLYLGVRATLTQRELSALVGVSERTILRSLKTLQAVGLLAYEGARGVGTSWQLLVVPEALPDAAREYYAAGLDRREQALERRKEELRQDREALDAAASGVAQERSRRLRAAIAGQADDDG